MEYIPTAEERKEYLAYDSYKVFFDNLKKGIEDIESLQFIRQKKKVILISGAMVVFDKGTIAFLNRIAEVKSDEYQFVLLSEVTAEYRRKTKDKIVFESICTPHLLAKEILVPYMDIPVTEEMTEYINKREYLKRAVANLNMRHKNIGDGYAEALIYYAEIYLKLLLKKLKPDKVILWNEFYAFHMVLQCLCRQRKIELKYMEFGCVPGTFVIEKGGQQGESMPARHPFFFHHLPIKRQDKAEADKTIQYIFRTELNRNIQPERNGELCQFLKRKTGKPVVTYM